MYSILAWPYGWSSSAGFSDNLKPIRVTIDEPASEILLIASAVMETLFETEPTMNFNILSNTSTTPTRRSGR